jgi:hypothetical protein
MLPEMLERIERLEIQRNKFENQRKSLIADYRHADSYLKDIIGEAVKIAQAVPLSYSFSEAEVCVVNGHILCEITKLHETDPFAPVEVISLLDDYSEYTTDRTMITTLPRHVQRDIRSYRREKSRIQKLLDGISRELVPILCEIETIHDENIIHFHNISNDGSVDVDSEIQRIKLEMENMLMQHKNLDERKRYLKRLLLTYHPDKRKNSSPHGDCHVFKFIQNSKEWFCQDVI